MEIYFNGKDISSLVPEKENSTEWNISPLSETAIFFFAHYLKSAS